MNFLKYHALGNDYLVISPQDAPEGLAPERIRRICHRNYGVGSDGILLGPLESRVCDFGLRIFNPDGSEAEKSGNGLRIFARALWDQQQVAQSPFTVETLGGAVTCTVAPGGRSVTVAMGRVSFQSTDIPVGGPHREVLNEEIVAAGRTFTFCAATVGNPHCIVFSPAPSPEEACRYGPLIETDARFPNRTNVQFMRVIDRKNIQIEIWERGAGYTLASGSSSTAAAAVARRLGLCGDRICVQMPGGRIELSFDDDFAATMTGSVTRVAAGKMAEEMFA
ncbi:MAG: diaminopimelate epimerase [Desulfobacterales bacterium]|nr:diaminopimelate epimerase [Desulfobacterales bacterium]